MDNLICMDLCCCSVAEAKQYLGEQVCVCVCVCVLSGEVSLRRGLKMGCRSSVWT